MSEYLLCRKIRRIGVWRGNDWGKDEQGLALDEIYDAHVRAGQGLSLWFVADDSDRNVVAAVMFELSGAAKVAHQDYFAIPESGLAALGYQPIPTPEATSSTHRRAPELHRDLVGLNEQDCSRLVNYLRDCFGDLHIRVSKSEVKAAVREELSHFGSPAVRTALSNACGLTWS